MEEASANTVLILGCPTLFLLFVSAFGIWNLLPRIETFFAKPEHRTLRLAIKPILLITFVALPFIPLVLVYSLVQTTIPPIASQASTDAEAEAFWDWFSTIENKLIDVRSNNDPILSVVAKKLKTVDKDLRFKLGPIREGETARTTKRELAISGKKNPSTVNTMVFVGANRKFSKWIIGHGFDPPETINYPDLTDTLGRKVDSKAEKNYKFELTRHGDTIDATIYTNNEIFESDIGTREPLDSILQCRLGGSAYHSLLGTVTLKKISKDKGNGAYLKTIREIWPEFEKLLTAAEKEDLSGIVSKRLPAVFQIQVDAAMRKVGFEPIITENIYAMDLHASGTGVDKVSQTKVSSRTYTYRKSELDQCQTPKDCLHWATICWKTCQIASARMLLNRAIANCKTPAEKQVMHDAQLFLKCKLPPHDVSSEARKVFNQAMLEISNDERGAARMHLKECLKLDRNFEWPYRHLSTIYRTAGDLDNAAIVARKAVTINPNYARGWAELALVLTHKGDPEFKDALQKAVSLDPSDEIVSTAQRICLEIQQKQNINCQAGVKSVMTEQNSLQARMQQFVNWAKELPVIRELLQTWG